MAYLTFVIPEVPNDRKQDFLAAWPTISSTIKGQDGVAGLIAGPVLAENGDPAVQFKFVQCIAFKTLEAMESFQSSAWAVENAAAYKEHGGGEPRIAKFEVSQLPENATPKPFLQYSIITLHDETKVEEAHAAWMDFAKALGKVTWGGQSIGDGPKMVLELFGWNSMNKAGEAYSKPEAAAALAKYKSFGKTKSVIIHVRK